MHYIIHGLKGLKSIKEGLEIKTIVEILKQF